MVTHDMAIAAQADRTVRLATANRRGVAGDRLPPRCNAGGRLISACDCRPHAGWQSRCNHTSSQSSPITSFMPLKVYISGKLFDKGDAKISVYDHGLLYGDGVFEGFAATTARSSAWQEHLDRLWNSAKAIWLEIPLSQAEMARAIEETLAVNGIKDGYIRAVVTRGSRHAGAGPQPLRKARRSSLSPITSPCIPKSCTARGWRSSPSARSEPPAALSPRIKSLNYLNNILAKIEGLQAGCIEALMLNHKGEVAECTGDKFSWSAHGKLLTPPTEAGILEGVTRDAVMQLAREAGMTVLKCR